MTRTAPSSAIAGACATTTATGKARRGAAIEKAETMPPHMPTQCTLPTRPATKNGNRDSTVMTVSGPVSDRAGVSRPVGALFLQVAVEHHADIADQQAAARRHGNP